MPAVPGYLQAGLRKPPLPPAETALVFITSLHLCFLPWALGTMHARSQLTSLAFSLAGFILAALPRPGIGNLATASRTIEWPVARLRRLPFFWAGLGLLWYIAMQALNPAWRFMSRGDAWWLEPVAHVSWLPSGVDAPFERSSPWRALMVAASWWLLVCSVWTGFLRRKSYRVLFTVLAGNAFLLALLGLLQKFSATTRIFWSYLPSNEYFFASFIYPNHAGSYLGLMVALAAGLAWWYWQRQRSGLEPAGPAGIFAFLAAATGLAVIFSYSRMSIVLLLAFTTLFGGCLAFGLFRRKGPFRSRPELLPLAAVVVGLLAVGLVSSQTEKVRERFAGMVANPASSDRDRSLVRQATVDMLRDRPLFGWGAGCFQYFSPGYVRNYPAISQVGNGVRLYWEHAHDDLLEIPAELGVMGLLPLAVILGRAAWLLVRRRFWRNAASLGIVLGCALVLLHAWVDFVFQNPAVLLTWSVLLAGAIRWTELEQPLGHRRPDPSRRPGLVPAVAPAAP